MVFCGSPLIRVSFVATDQWASPKRCMEDFSRHNSSLIGRKNQAKLENYCIARSEHRFKITQPNLMIMVSFSSVENCFNLPKEYELKNDCIYVFVNIQRNPETLVPMWTTWTLPISRNANARVSLSSRRETTLTARRTTTPNNLPPGTPATTTAVTMTIQVSMASHILVTGIERRRRMVFSRCKTRVQAKMVLLWVKGRMTRGRKVTPIKHGGQIAAGQMQVRG